MSNIIFQVNVQCDVCGKQQHVRVERHGFWNFMDGEDISTLFPYSASEWRDVLIGHKTGTYRCNDHKEEETS